MGDVKLMAHQQAAVEKARSVQNLALFCEAGTGKTGTLIRILCEEFNKRKGVVNTLIFAPMSVCAQYPGEFERFSKLPLDRVLVLTGDGKKRVAALKKARASGKGFIVITNYEAVQIKDFYAELLNWSPNILALDESHRIKDATSKRAKKIYPFAMAAYRRFLMTGTPFPNSMLDIFGQYKALDPNIFGASYFGFRGKYFYDKNSGGQFSYPEWIPQAWAETEIGKKLAESSIQAKREDCLDLPPLSIVPWMVEMSGPQAKAYTEMKKEFVTELNGMVASSEFEMVKTLRMQQILAGFVKPDDDTQEVQWFEDQPRLDALMDLIESIGPKEKVIVWTVFRPTYKKIEERLKKAGIEYAFLTGDQTGAAAKQAAITAFTQGTARVLVANPAAASEGINLQQAKYAIYFMRGHSLLHYLQSLARNYRSGTEKLHDKVVHFHLLTRGTLDEVIANALLKKENVAKAVLSWANPSIPLDSVKSNASVEQPKEITI